MYRVNTEHCMNLYDDDEVKKFETIPIISGTLSTDIILLYYYNLNIHTNRN